MCGEPGAVSWQMLYMLLAGSQYLAARPGNESARGNVYATDGGPMGGPYPMLDDDFLNHPTGVPQFAQVSATSAAIFSRSLLQEE